MIEAEEAKIISSGKYETAKFIKDTLENISLKIIDQAHNSKNKIIILFNDDIKCQDCINITTDPYNVNEIAEAVSVKLKCHGYTVSKYNLSICALIIKW